MNALLNHYNVRHQLIVFTASCYASLHLTVQAVRPPVERIWRKLSGDEALDLYAYCIVAIYDIAILLGKVAIALANDYRHWADAFVESHLPPVPAALPTPEAVEPIELMRHQSSQNRSPLTYPLHPSSVNPKFPQLLRR